MGTEPDTASHIIGPSTTSLPALALSDTPTLWVSMRGLLITVPELALFGILLDCPMLRKKTGAPIKTDKIADRGIDPRNECRRLKTFWYFIWKLTIRTLIKMREMEHSLSLCLTFKNSCSDLVGRI